MKLPNWLNLGKVVIASLTFGLLAGSLGPAAEKDREEIARGKELFQRDWLPGDLRSHSGDGLGPLFNARSCVACHQLGGIGGAGAKHTNVTVVSVFLIKEEGSGIGGLFGWFFGVTPKPPKPLLQPDRAKLAEIHPTLRTENSFPLHRFGTEKEFAKWNRDALGQFSQFNFNAAGLEIEDVAELSGEPFSAVNGFGGFPVTREVGGQTLQLVSSERNAPALFGAGIIDSIPARVLEDVAASQASAAQEESSAKVTNRRVPMAISGRVARLKDGRIGRFGWKGQIATLRDFTFQACALELGLEVPGFPQTAPPWKTDYKAPGLDMTGEQCDALVKFVAALPRPTRKPAETAQHAAEIGAGQKLFERAGCAVCHQPKLGDVDGIYSDLLLHDMGQSLSDNGFYGGVPIFAGEGAKGQIDPLPVLSTSGQEEKKPKFGAASREWRTPPLWGLRDSAPYLHDGRAGTISVAVSFHGGEGFESARNFTRLSVRERQQLELFLQSLAAPTP
jgi:CxxC motif-containing protein (DUF1111 family)